MSKGSNRRPAKVTAEEFDQRWAETFGGGSKNSASYEFAMLRDKWEAEDRRSYMFNLEVTGNDMFGINELVDRRRAGQFTNRDPDAG